MDGQRNMRRNWINFYEIKHFIIDWLTLLVSTLIFTLEP